MKLGMTDLLEQTPVNSDGRGRRVNQDVSLVSLIPEKIRKKRFLNEESLKF